MAARGAALVPTMAVAYLLREHAEEWGVPAEVLPKVDPVLDAMRASIKVAHANGVAIGSGSDILGPRQNRRGLELALKAEVLDPMAAIVSATATNAAIMRVEDRLGTVTPGKLADLIAVDGDPLADPWVFDDPDRVVVVVKDGVIVKDRR
jgi:imidazolonepropionase-like amidohydrolase